MRVPVIPTLSLKTGGVITPPLSLLPSEDWWLGLRNHGSWGHPCMVSLGFAWTLDFNIAITPSGFHTWALSWRRKKIIQCSNCSEAGSSNQACLCCCLLVSAGCDCPQSIHSLILFSSIVMQSPGPVHSFLTIALKCVYNSHFNSGINAGARSKEKGSF